MNIVEYREDFCLIKQLCIIVVVLRLIYTYNQIARNYIYTHIYTQMNTCENLYKWDRAESTELHQCQ